MKIETSQKITPYLWYDHQAKEAADFYCSLFPDAKIISASDMIVEYELAGTQFIGLNGGPKFTFTEAVSFLITCRDQEEVDHYWYGLTAKGGEESMCGWLRDRYGLSWQVVPERFLELMKTGDPDRTRKVLDALMNMQRIVISDLENAYNS
ncbi:MAG: VOC family protein [Cyclobacteriaceae bacterium]